MIRRNGGLLVIVLIIIGSFGCARSFHSKRIKNVDESMVKAALEERKHVRITALYNYNSPNFMKGADYIFLIEKVDQDSIYGHLDLAKLKYHKSTGRNFGVKKELIISGTSTDINTIGNPGEVLHLYTRNQALAEGDFNLALMDVHYMGIHEKGNSGSYI